MAVVLADIRQAVADAVGTISGVAAYAYEPSVTATSSSSDTAVMVLAGGPPYVDFNGSFGNARLVQVNLVLRIACQAVDLQSAQARVDELISCGSSSPMSIYEALRTDRTLDGVVENLDSPAVPTPQLVEFEDGRLAPQLIVDIPLVVYVRRD
jgi:hypothetical protein